MNYHIDTTGEDAFRARIASPAPVAGLGPLDTAICGALERLAEESSRACRLARADGDKAGGTFWQRNATSYCNALIEYRRGVRPELLASGAWLLPSRRPGEAPHIVRMDGDWICSCKAGASMHWSVAMIIGIEVAHDDLSRFDDGDVEDAGVTCPSAPTCGDSSPVSIVSGVIALAHIGARLCVARRESAYAV